MKTIPSLRVARSLLSKLTTLSALAVAGNADELNFTFQFPQRPLTILETFELPRFDSSRGALQVVRVRVESRLVGTAQLENIGSSPIVVTTTVSSEIALTLPARVVQFQPMAQFTNVLMPFDGTIDYSGTSGVTHAVDNAVAQPDVMDSLSDMGHYIGPGAVIRAELASTDRSLTSVDQHGVLHDSSGMRQDIDVFVTYSYSPGVTYSCSGNGLTTACPCGNRVPAGSIAGCANSFGHGASLAALGNALVSDDTLQLFAAGLPDATIATFFQGTTRLVGGAGVAFGDGLRCVGGTIVRFGFVTAANGAITYPADGGERISMQSGLSAGNVRHYQVQYRDAAPTYCSAAGFNSTNAVSVFWRP